MLKKIQLTLQSEYQISLPMSSLFHGVLIQQLSRNYAEKMHESTVRPYSQFLDEALNQWNIQVVNEEAAEEIEKPILKDDFSVLCLEKRGWNIPIIEKKVIVKSYDELLKETYFGNCKRYITIKFLTPTAFKQKKNYVCYPDIRLLFQSIIQKHDAIQNKTKFQDEQVLEDIIEYTKIARYNLRTKPFDLEGIRIQGFVGTVTLKIGGPQMLVNLIHFLLSYAQYSGVGIKTAIGMGAMIVKEERRREDGKTEKGANYWKSIS